MACSMAQPLPSKSIAGSSVWGSFWKATIKVPPRCGVPVCAALALLLLLLLELLPQAASRTATAMAASRQAAA
jgi:hypothetical protein